MPDMTPEQHAILQLSQQVMLLEEIIRQLADANRMLMRERRDA